MPAHRFTRREVLALGAGAAVLAACGSKSSAGSGDSSAIPDQPAVISADLYATPQPQRLAFTMLSPTNRQPHTGDRARIALPEPDGKLGPFVDATARGEGLGAFRAVYTVEATLPTAGAFNAVVEYKGTRIPLGLQVNAKPQCPAPGEPAPRAASPTTAKPLGAKHVCTRTPPCPLHTKSLSDVIGKGRPVAVLFATPEFCQTAYCGEVLGALLPMVPKYVDRIDVVHVEIYLDDPNGGHIPTVDAWNLPSEPWLFGVDAKGVVTARLDGAFDAGEMRDVLDGLVS